MGSIFDENGVLYLIVGAVLFHLFIIALIIVHVCKASCKDGTCSCCTGQIPEERQGLSNRLSIDRLIRDTSSHIAPRHQRITRDMARQRTEDGRAAADRADSRRSTRSSPPPIYSIQIDVSSRGRGRDSASEVSQRPLPFSGLPTYGQVVGNEPNVNVATQFADSPPPYEEAVKSPPV